MHWIGKWRNQYGSVLEISADSEHRIVGRFTTALADSGFAGQEIPIIGFHQGDCIGLSGGGRGPAGDMLVTYTGLFRDGKLEKTARPRRRRCYPSSKPAETHLFRPGAVAMSMSQKAFVFDHARFERELRERLLAALAADDARPLEAFINANQEAIKDAYEGEAVRPDWRNQFRPADAQAYADFALTKYYEPSDDLGLDTDWPEANAALEQAGLQGALLLGSALATSDGAVTFDPGRQGSYFPVRS
jgi:hypothetical protein